MSNSSSNGKFREPKFDTSSPSIQSNTRPPIPSSPQHPPDELEELQRKKHIIQMDISRIIKKFDEVKHRLYTNKEKLIEQELTEMRDNTHPMLKSQLEELEEQRRRKRFISQLKKDLINKTITLEYTTTKDQADFMYLEGKKSIRRALLKYFHNQLVQLANENQLKFDQVFSDANLDQSLKMEIQLLPKGLTMLNKQEIENDLLMMNKH